MTLCELEVSGHGGAGSGSILEHVQVTVLSSIPSSRGIKRRNVKQTKFRDRN